MIAVLKKGAVYDITGTLYSTTSVHWFPRTPEMKKDLLEAIKQNQFITNFKFKNSIDNDLEKEINIITKNNKDENFLKIAGIGKEGYGDLYILPPEIKHVIFNKISFFDIDYTVNNSQESNVNMLGQEVENI